MFFKDKEMAYEEFPPKYIIDYTVDSPASIKQALNQYCELLIDNKGFIQNYCVIQFRPNRESIELAVFNDHPVIKQALTKEIISYFRSADQTNLVASLLTETLFFAIANTFVELKQEVVKACEVIGLFARRLNDSSEMWITCEQPFGLEPIYLSARVYPEYGYLLGCFYVPYWDDEHMPEARILMRSWMEKQQNYAYLLKAFCYCDYGEIREQMLGYSTEYGTYEKMEENSFELLKYIRESEDNYQAFKDALVERFEKMPYLKRSNHPDDQVSNPIQDFVMDILASEHPYNSWDDDFDMYAFMEHTFVSLPAYQEVEQLTAYVCEKVGEEALVAIGKDKKLNQFKKPKSKDLKNPFLGWEAFIKDQLTNGEVLWNYIISKEDIDKLPQVEKVNIFRQLQYSKEELLKGFDFIYDMESLWEELAQVLKKLFKKYKKYLEANGQNELDAEMLLRFLDVLFVLNDGNPFEEEVEKLCAKKYKLCTVFEFRDRYAISWDKELENVLASFGKYNDDVYQEQLDAITGLIEGNRALAVEAIPEKFLVLPNTDYEDDDDFLLDMRKFGTTEMVVLANHIVHLDKQNNRNDALTKACKQYVETCVLDLLFSDFYDNTELPKTYLINMVVNKTKNSLSKQDIAEIEEVLPKVNALKDYFTKGTIVVDGKSLDEIESQAYIYKLIDQYITVDDRPVSKKQPEIEWLANRSDHTQKLLWVAYVEQLIDAESVCAKNVKRFLELAFYLAPIRTSCMLLKGYKPERYEQMPTDQLVEVLTIFKAQGLSDKGYWGTIIDRLTAECSIEETPLYQTIAKEFGPLFFSSADKVENTQCEEKVKAFKEGLALVSTERQVVFFKDLAIYYPDQDFSSYFLDFMQVRLQDELSQRLKIQYPLAYLKSWFDYDKIEYQYIEWSQWHDFPEWCDFVEQGEVGNYSSPAVKEYLNKCFDDLTEWNYIVVEKIEGVYKPIYGLDTLAYIKENIKKEDINQAKCNVIVFEGELPQKYRQDLDILTTSDYVSRGKELAHQYLNTGVLTPEAERFFRFGIYYYEFLQDDGFYDFSIEDVLLKMPVQSQGALLNMLAFVSPKEGLKLHLDINEVKYFAILLNFKVDPTAIMFWLLEEEDMFLLKKLVDAVDMRESISRLKVKEQIDILTSLAEHLRFKDLILSFGTSKVTRIKEHVYRLVEKRRLISPHFIPTKIVDYGIYKMLGNTEPIEGTELKVATDPVCIEQAIEVTVELGMYIGLRFTSCLPDLAPKVSTHEVTVLHPVWDEEKQHYITNTVQWTQNGYSAADIFLGWHFENEEELVPGQYVITAKDLNGVELARKSFIVHV